MSKRYTGNYLLRWTDSQGKYQEKVYRDIEDAKKALKWLEDKGCNDADIAVQHVVSESKESAE